MLKAYTITIKIKGTIKNALLAVVVLISIISVSGYVSVQLPKDALYATEQIYNVAAKPANQVQFRRTRFVCSNVQITLKTALNNQLARTHTNTAQLFYRHRTHLFLNIKPSLTFPVRHQQLVAAIS